MIATAPPVRRWLLLEQPRGWPETIMASADLDGSRERIGAAVQARRGRLLFIRRPGRPQAPGLRRWFVIDPVTRTESSGVWEPRLGLDEALTAFARDGAQPDPVAVRLLVCTHGRHDQCCAVRGRPVAAAVSATFPQETWECSHLGGDRFAGNLVVLPSGTYYGQLDPATAVDVVLAHRERRVAATHLRGVTTLPPVGQAALTGVLAQFGPGPIGDLTARILPGGGPTRWRVVVTGHPLAPEVLVEVRRGILPPVRRACRASEEEVAVTYSAVVTDVVGPKTTLGERVQGEGTT
ncbi:MAG: sucrase ferredoxin [Dermatophilaceae bacterium]